MSTYIYVGWKLSLIALKRRKEELQNDIEQWAQDRVQVESAFRRKCETIYKNQVLTMVDQWLIEVEPQLRQIDANRVTALQVLVQVIEEIKALESRMVDRPCNLTRRDPSPTPQTQEEQEEVRWNFSFETSYNEGILLNEESAQKASLE